MAIRRQLSGPLRSKLDTMDIVQSVWADVLCGFREAGWRFTDRSHLRAFLMKVARNRLIDRRRQHHRAIEQERPLDQAAVDLPSAKQPRPSEIAQEHELWKRMLDECSPGHREILILKRQGLPNAEIARRTGLHEGSIRRILYELARRMSIPRRAVRGPSGRRGRGGLTHASRPARQPGSLDVVPSSPGRRRRAGSDESWVSREVERMAAAWSRGQRLTASEIIDRHPGLADEAAVRLIYEEVSLRREAGEDVPTTEVVGRYPRWKDELEVLLGCDRLLRPIARVADLPEVGEHLGPFFLRAELGRGASGKTYLASEPTLADRPVVLKVISDEQEEHLSLARLQHTQHHPLVLGAHVPRPRTAGAVHALPGRDEPGADHGSPPRDPARPIVGDATSSTCWIASRPPVRSRPPPMDPIVATSRTMQEAIEHASRGTAGFHLSFDMDAVDPQEAPGVGTPVRGGMTYREAHLAMETVSDSGKMVSMEMVEVNPVIDEVNRTALLAVELVMSAMGKRIL